MAVEANGLARDLGFKLLDAVATSAAFAILISSFTRWPRRWGAARSRRRLTPGTWQNCFVWIVFSYDQVRAVVLETTGEVTVLHAEDDTTVEADLLADVRGAHRLAEQTTPPDGQSGKA